MHMQSSEILEPFYHLMSSMICEPEDLDGGFVGSAKDISYHRKYKHGQGQYPSIHRCLLSFRAFSEAT